MVPADQLPAGWAVTTGTVTVTPTRPVLLGGYAARSGPSTGVLDSLEVNLLQIQDRSGGRLAWVSIDSVAVTAPLRAAIAGAVCRLIDCEPADVVISASHTHCAPSGWVGAILPALPAPVEPDLLAELHARILDMPLRRATGELSWFETTVDRVAANRNDPEGPCDSRASGLVVHAAGEATPLALMFEFGCHPTVLGPQDRVLSADWVGRARDGIRRRFGGLPVVFAQGAAGDVSTRFRRRGRGAPELERLGALVAGPVVAAAVSPTLISGDRVSRKRHRVPVPSRWAAGSTLWLTVTELSIGDRRWLTMPAEVVASLGQRLADQHPGLRLITCTDDYHGYLADETGHRRGWYEATSSPLTWPDTADLVDLLEGILA